jgi:hypothetical protein
MKNKLIEIPIVKGRLFLYEDEIMNNLPPQVLKEGLKRGKAIKRSQQFKNRLEKMKGSGDLSDDY